MMRVQMFCDPAAPALKAVRPKYVPINRIRRPNSSDSGAHLESKSAETCPPESVVIALKLTYNRGPMAKPNTKREIPKVKIS
jgi:hypothetical protein